MIPKLIIQTGRSRALPLLHRAVVANIRLLNPEFEYRFFDDADVLAFVTREFPQYRPVFEGFRFRIQRYDFFRYLAVHRYGGFYLDLDVLLARSLSPLVHHQCVFPFDDLSTSRFLRQTLGMDWTVGNYAFGARPGHPFLWAAIQGCIRGLEDPSWIEPALLGIPRAFRDDFVVLNATGPLLLSRIFQENRASSDVTILFPDDVRDPETWHRFGRFGVHLMEGSWRAKERPLRRRLRMLWESWTSYRLLKGSSRLGPTRSVPPDGAAARPGRRPLLSTPPVSKRPRPEWPEES
jgi:mannosyltransferase OCH1-like enzyme